MAIQIFGGGVKRAKSGTHYSGSRPREVSLYREVVLTSWGAAWVSRYSIPNRLGGSGNIKPPPNVRGRHREPGY